MQTRKPYAESFKQEAIKLVTERNMAPTQVARDLGVGRDTLHRWFRAARPAVAQPNDTSTPAADLAQLRRDIEQLRMDRDILKSTRHLVTDATVTQKYTCMAAHVSNYPVTVLCRVLGVSRSGYYGWKPRPMSPRAQHDAVLGTQIRLIFKASRRRDGSPQLHATLRTQGIRCSNKRVACLMRPATLVARTKRRGVRTADSRHAHPIAPNVVDRNFQVHAPNQVWVADIRDLLTREGWLYLAVVLDVYARRVVGWSTAETVERTLVLTAFAARFV